MNGIIARESMISRKLKLSRMEKILLHLNKFNRFKEIIEVPPSITQEGIAKATGLALPKVSTTVKKLKENGFVDERVLHIQGNKRRKKAYFLTDAGIRAAASLRIGLELSRYVDFADHVPEFRIFYGRVKELKAFEAWLQSDTYRVLVVSGIAGIGKTAFVSKAIENPKESMHIFWHRLNEWSTLRSLLTRMGDFLAEVNRGTLNANLHAKDKIDLNEILKILTKDLDYLNALFVFDDYQKVKDNKEITHLFGALRQLLESVSGTKMIVMGREIPRFFYDEREVTLGKRVKEVILKGLDKKSSMELLAGRGIVGIKGKMLHDATKGHPLFLELMEGQEKVETQNVVKKYIVDEVFARLTPEERKILEIASVFRFPIYPVAYLEITGTKDIGYDIIESLVEKSLLQISGEVCDIHDVVRDFSYSQIPKQRKKKYHKEIAKYYQKEVPDTPQSALESQHHFILAEDYNKAAELVIETCRKLIFSGYWQEVQETIKRVPFESIDPEHIPEILLARAYIYEMQGKLNEALDDYRRSIDLFGKINKNTGEAIAYRRIGVIMMGMCKWDIALENYERVREITQEIKDLNGIATAHWGIGLVLLRKGEVKKALETLKIGLEYSKKGGNGTTTAAIYSTMSEVMFTIGKIGKSIEYQIKGLTICEQIGNKYSLSRAYTNLGALYFSNGEFKKAIELHEKTIKLANEIKDINGLASALINAAECYRDTENLNKALEYCNRAASVADNYNEINLKSNLHLVYGSIYKIKEDWNLSEKHFKKALRFSSEANFMSMTALAHFHYGMMLNEMGRSEEAKKHFGEAMELYIKLGNKDMVEAVKGEMKKLQ